MKRAKFGAIIEMCSMWMSQDPRASMYRDISKQKGKQTIKLCKSLSVARTLMKILRVYHSCAENVNITILIMLLISILSVSTVISSRASAVSFKWRIPGNKRRNFALRWISCKTTIRRKFNLRRKSQKEVAWFWTWTPNKRHLCLFGQLSRTASATYLRAVVISKSHCTNSEKNNSLRIFSSKI